MATLSVVGNGFMPRTPSTLTIGSVNADPVVFVLDGSWELSLPLQAMVCTVLITAVEFVAGLVLNVWLGLGIWDYSNLPLNLCGQTCLWYSALWYVLSLIFIPVFDWLRYWVQGGERPHYYFL